MPLKFFSTNQPGILVRADGAQMAMGDSKTCQTKRRIVFTTFGSLGDLYPYIALAREMQERGHEAIIATSRHYRQKIESRGIGFYGIRPDGPDIDADSDIMRRIMDRRKGGEYIIRELLMPVLEESYEDLLTAAEGADLLVSHVLTFTARLVAERKGLPWATTFLQPLGFFSACDPPVLPQLPFLSKLRFLGAPFHRALFGVA
jgi:rhamnosyltransferase subunit B